MLASVAELIGRVMWHQRLRQAARGAFSQDDWVLLMNDALVLRHYTELNHLEDVERFIFEAHDRLRFFRERLPQLSEVDQPARLARLM